MANASLERRRIPQPINSFVGPDRCHHRAPGHIPEAGQDTQIHCRIFCGSGERFDRIGEFSTTCQDHATLRLETSCSLARHGAYGRTLLGAKLWMSLPPLVDFRRHARCRIRIHDAEGSRRAGRNGPQLWELSLSDYFWQPVCRGTSKNRDDQPPAAVHK